MKYLPVSNSDTTLVDDYFHINEKLFLNSRGYVQFNRGKRTIMLHRYVLGYNGTLQVHHINGNKLDNRKSNLKIVNSSQNNFLKERKPGKSGYNNVVKKGNKYYANLKVDGFMIHSEGKSTALEAYEAALLLIKLHRPELEVLIERRLK